MSELVLISRDGFPYSSVCVNEESVFSNSLQSFLNSAQDGGSFIVINGTVEQEM